MLTMERKSPRIRDHKRENSQSKWRDKSEVEEVGTCFMRNERDKQTIITSDYPFYTHPQLISKA